MDAKDRNQNAESDHGLGSGYEPLAVCLMILFIWMFIVSVGTTIMH